MIHGPGADAALLGIAALARYISFHTDVPGPDGEHLVGTRMAAQWADPANNSMQLLMPVQCWLEPCTVRYYGLWTLADGGRFLADSPLDAPIEVKRAGTLRLRSATFIIPGGSA